MENLGVPFVTRKMMPFEHGTTFDLFVQVLSETTQQLNVRGFTKEGPFDFSLQVSGAAQNQGVTFGLPDFPIWLSVETDESDDDAGSAFVLVRLRLNQTPYITLCAGYPRARAPLTWPHDTVHGPLEQKGQIVSLTGSDPAAGAEISQTVPANNWWRLKLIRASLVTDATAATRRPRIDITVNGILVASMPSIHSHVASTTVIYTFAEGLATMTDGIGLVALNTLPLDVILPPGSVIASVTANLQAGDNWGAPTFLFERLLAL